MKQTIRKILKEDRQEKYYQLVINYIEKNGIWEGEKVFTMFGLGERDIKYFEGEALRLLNDVEGMSFDTNDYPSLSFGSYEFKFTIKRIVDFESYYKEQREIEIEVEINSGTVDIDGETIDVITAGTHDDYGWEVQSEMQDCVNDIIRYLIPETVAGNLQIDVRVHA